MGEYYDFSGINYDAVIKNYNEQVEKNKAKIKKYFGTALIVFGAIMSMIITLVPGIQGSGDSLNAYIFISVFVSGIIVIGFIINNFMASEKPFHVFIVKEMVDYVNFINKSTLKYDSYPKKQKFVNEEGGLFTRFANVRVKDRISGTTEKYINFTWYNMKLSVSTGKSQRTLFDGMYFVIEYPLGKIFQLRTHSSPRLKGTKFERVDKESPLKIYVPKDDETHNVDERFINLVRDMKIKLGAKKIYLSSVGNRIHFAYESREKFKKPKHMDAEVLKGIVDKINGIVSVANDVSSGLNQ